MTALFTTHPKIFLYVVFPLSLIMTFFISQNSLNTLLNWEKGTATITSFDYKFDLSNKHNYKIEYTYSFSGKNYTENFKSRESFWLKKGDKVGIYINPQNPSQTRLSRSVFTYLSISILIPLFLIYLYLKSKKQNDH